MQWQSGSRTLDIRTQAAVVGILNVTPDSYFDGGQYVDIESIVSRARMMRSEGADVIEIGGESTGPGSSDVSTDEECARVIPAVQSIRSALPDAWIAVDTYKSGVAREAIAAGADMINDVTAGRGDDAMFACIAEAGVPYVMMFSKDPTARTTKEDVRYDDVVGHITSFLHERKEKAMEAGVRESRLIVDPGLGHFVSADPAHSFHILFHLEAFARIAPVFVSPSRKSFLAGPNNLPPGDRWEGTLAATAIALEHGARFIRTHDVRATCRVRDLLSPFLPSSSH